MPDRGGATAPRVGMTGGRIQAHIHYRRGRLLLRGYAELARFIGQSRQSFTDPVLYAYGCCIWIDAGSKGDHELKAAVGAGDRLHVHNAFDAVDRLFERLRNRLGDLLRIGPRIGCTHNYARRYYLRIFTGRKNRNRDQTESEDDDR